MGSGAAGLAGALSAAIDGASVIVIEKAAVLGGTTAVSGGSLWIPVNHHMASRGVSDSREEALAYMRACAGDQGEDEHLVALVDHGAPMVRFLEERAGIPFWAWPAVGGAIDYRPWHPGWKPGARPLDVENDSLEGLGEWASSVRVAEQPPRWGVKAAYYEQRMHVAPPSAGPAPEHGERTVYSSGVALVIRLLRACLHHGVGFRTRTPAIELLRDEARVTGVRAERAGRSFYVRARVGVLLATGGFSASEELKRLWLSRPLDATCEVESNTGDGHLMGLAAGASVAGLGDAWWMPQIQRGVEADGSPAFVGSREDRTVPHVMMVNRDARRFVNEAMNYYDAGEAFGTKTGGGPRNNPAWFVFDSQAREKYSIIAAKFPGGEVPPWMASAGTPAQLADLLDLDAGRFSASVERFNAFARSGVDEDFGRGVSEWDRAWGDPAHQPNPSLGTLETPPFYALPIRAGALATRGGLRVGAHGEVRSALPPFAPIDGLYAAGNCSNASVAGAYTGPGATIGAAMTFGYLAGRHAAGAVRVGQPGAMS